METSNLIRFAFDIGRAVALGFGPPKILSDCVLDSGSSSSSPVHARARSRVVLEDISNQEIVSFVSCYSWCQSYFARSVLRVYEL